MICIWILLTQEFAELIFVLKPQRKGPKVPFVSSLNSFVTRSLWIVENTYSVKLAPNPFFYSSLNRFSSSTVQKMKFSIKGFFSKCEQINVAVLVTFTE